MTAGHFYLKFESSVKHPDQTTSDFIGFEKSKRIIKIIVIFRTKFAYILKKFSQNTHKIDKNKSK